MDIITLFFIAAVGLILGSFSSALIWRIPLKQDWVSQRSACPNCKNVLGFFDLIPVFSWLFSRGTCRYCGHGVSAIYPLLEIFCVVLCVGSWILLDSMVDRISMLVLMPFFISLVVIDLKKMILPNQLVFICFLIALGRFLYLCFLGEELFSFLFREYIAGAFLYAIIPLVLSVVLSKILKKETMGMGDVKLLFVLGFLLGLSQLPYIFILAGVIAILHGLYVQILMKSRLFPFGPSLIIAFYILFLVHGSHLI